MSDRDDESGQRATGDLLRLMTMLRDPDRGCRWDLKQRMETLTSHTLEEVYEVIDAVENGSPEAICNELGDLLFQVVFYSQIARENGWFDFGDVASGVTAKLLHRHPHVFPDGTLESFGEQQDRIDPRQVESNWEAIKNEERRRQAGDGHGSVMDDVPHAMPAIQRAAKLQKRAASRGFDWAETGAVLNKVREELDELQQAVQRGSLLEQESELGDLLFTCVNLSRHLNVDTERALRGSNRRFEQRFRRMEGYAGKEGVSLEDADPAELESWWQRAKREEGIE